MPLAIPPDLKRISPYVRRAEELDKDKGSPESRLVAYYCRQYAVHTGIPLAGSSAASKTCLGHLLENLEKEKPAMDNFTRDEAAFLCRKFANKVFDKADEEDRLGLATQLTAKAFYAASTFLQILEQFSSEEDQSEERLEDRKRIIYAKWKSTDILKAIKEGRTPQAGGYGVDDDPALEIVEGQVETVDEADDEKKQDAPAPLVETVHSYGSTFPAVETVQKDDDDDDVVTNVYTQPPTPPSSTMIPTPVSKQTEKVDNDADEGLEIELGPPPAYPGPVTASTSATTNSSSKSTTNYNDRPKISFELPPPAPVMPTPVPAPSHTTRGGGLFGFAKKKAPAKITKEQLADAVELARFALAALEDKDAELGAERLQQALNVLGR